jgi:PilZ domain
MASRPPSQREHPRGPIQARVRYFEWNQPHDAVATEIGGGGIFLETSAPATEGSLLTIRVALPIGKSFTVLGRVVRTVRGSWARLRKTGMGIQFIDLSAGDRNTVIGYLEHHAVFSR